MLSSTVSLTACGSHYLCLLFAYCEQFSFNLSTILCFSLWKSIKIKVGVLFPFHTQKHKELHTYTMSKSGASISGNLFCMWHFLHFKIHRCVFFISLHFINIVSRTSCVYRCALIWHTNIHTETYMDDAVLYASLHSISLCFRFLT